MYNNYFVGIFAIFRMPLMFCSSTTYIMCRIRYVSSNDVLDSIVVEKQQTSLNLQYKVVCALLYTHATSLLLLLSAAPIEFAHNGAKKLKKRYITARLEWDRVYLVI